MGEEEGGWGGSIIGESSASSEFFRAIWNVILLVWSQSRRGTYGAAPAPVKKQGRLRNTSDDNNLTWSSAM